MDSAEHDLLLDLEQADARADALLEGGETWDVNLNDLDARDGMLLLFGMKLAKDNCPKGSPPYERALEMEDEIIAQTGKLGETVKETREAYERFHESQSRRENPTRPLKVVYG